MRFPDCFWLYQRYNISNAPASNSEAVWPPLLFLLPSPFLFSLYFSYSFFFRLSICLLFISLKNYLLVHKSHLHIVVKGPQLKIPDYCRSHCGGAIKKQQRATLCGSYDDRRQFWRAPW